MKNLREKFRKIDFIFVFLPFLIPVENLIKQGKHGAYPMAICCLITGWAFAKVRYNWVHFDQNYRDKLKKRLFENRKVPFSQKLNSGYCYVELNILIILLLTPSLFYFLFQGAVHLALGAFIADLLFIALLYTFIKF
jgi:hypothetical protein